MERWERLRVSDAARTRHARPSCRARLCSMPSIACKKPTRTSTQHRSQRGTLQDKAGCLSEGGWGLHSPVHSLSRPARARPLRATTCPRAQLPSGRGRGGRGGGSTRHNGQHRVNVGCNVRQCSGQLPTTPPHRAQPFIRVAKRRWAGARPRPAQLAWWRKEDGQRGSSPDRSIPFVVCPWTRETKIPRFKRLYGVAGFSY